MFEEYQTESRRGNPDKNWQKHAHACINVPANMSDGIGETVHKRQVSKSKEGSKENCFATHGVLVQKCPPVDGFAVSYPYQKDNKEQTDCHFAAISGKRTLAGEYKNIFRPLNTQSAAQNGLNILWSEHVKEGFEYDANIANIIKTC